MGLAARWTRCSLGDGIWHDQFLGDAGIMEKMITEKRVAWDQVQREIIVAHYSLFM